MIFPRHWSNLRFHQQLSSSQWLGHGGSDSNPTFAGVPEAQFQLVFYTNPFLCRQVGYSRRASKDHPLRHLVDPNQLPTMPRRDAKRPLRTQASLTGGPNRQPIGRCSMPSQRPTHSKRWCMVCEGALPAIAQLSANLPCAKSA
jgi:hypothetical protein